MFRRLLTFSVLSIALASPAIGHAQTVDEIVAKNLAAKGGLEKIKAVSTLRQTGTMTIQGMAATVTSTSERPNKSRQDINIAGQNMIMVFDGTKAFMTTPASPDPMEVPAEQAAMVKDQADMDGPLVDYKAKGSTVELVGTETVDGKKAFHLKVTRPSLPQMDINIDATTYLETKIVTNVPGSGTLETQLGDYRTVDGLTVPFSIKSSAAGMTVSELKLDKVEFNVKLDPNTFKIK